MSSDAERQAKIDRWNMYKSRMDSAGSAVIRATQFLVRPTEGFPACRLGDIEPIWRIWRDEEECFYRMVQFNDTPPKRTFPKMPEVDAEECCYRMWGLLIQVQIDGTFGSTRFLGDTVQQIVANQKCKSHPATCACHVPDHPWTSREDVDALAPLNPRHNPNCQCAGWQRCASREMANAAAAAAVRAKKAAEAAMAEQAAAQAPAPVPYSSPCAQTALGFEARSVWGSPAAAAEPSIYEYKHNVDTCACGTCHKARMDSGTADAYLARIQARTHEFSLALEPCGGREYRAPRSSCSSMLQAAANADTVIAAANAASGGSTGHPDFAKNIFAAMGTPHDSKCPHGLPFYSCMPCSH
jgi:hypothetical protein